MSRGMRLFAAAVLTAGLAACGGGPKEKFYSLAGDGNSATLPSLDYAVVVGPVHVPDVVDRPQFVLRTPGAEVRIAEDARWAEPLKYGIGRVVAANVANGLQNARVTSQAETSAGIPDYRVVLDVQRFDSVTKDGAIQEVNWTVRRIRDGEQQTGRVRIHEPVAGAGGYPELAAAHARALAGVSQSIVDAIRASRQKELAAPGAAAGKR
jgi:uncharacterized lipoprotein YmbA